MKNHTDSAQSRFGDSGHDSRQLVDAWNQSRPAPPTSQWNEVWANVVAASGSGEAPKQVLQGSAGRFWKLALAASLALTAWFAWPNEKPESQRLSIAQSHSSNEPQVIETATVTSLVSIDLNEADDLAIIRIDDEKCTAEKPCLESVEAQTADFSGNSLASNFQLFNDMESLALDLQ